MKSLLIIGTPKNCGDCPCAGEEFGICQADEKHRDCDWYKIPSWCPLKPMPQKKEVEVNEIEDIMHTEYSIEDIYTNKYVATIRLATDKLISLGWNACLEEMEK